MLKECSFCSEFIDKTDENNKFHELIGKDYFSRVIWENENFILTPTIGCFKEGYVILLTKKHIPNFGFLNTREMENLKQVVFKVQNMIIDIYGDCLFFEHGSNDCITLGGGACVDHAHIHFVPLKFDIKSKISKIFNPTEYKSLNSLSQYSRNETPYLMFNSNKESIFITEAYNIQSQFLRILITDEINLSGFWNWREYPFIENMINTFERLKKNNSMNK